MICASAPAPPARAVPFDRPAPPPPPPGTLPADPFAFRDPPLPPDPPPFVPVPPPSPAPRPAPRPPRRDYIRVGVARDEPGNDDLDISTATAAATAAVRSVDVRPP